MERDLRHNDDYIEFLLGIKDFCKEKLIIAPDRVIKDAETYEVNVCICALQEGFQIVILEGDRCAFIFKEEVYILRVTCSDYLMSEEYEKSRLN